MSVITEKTVDLADLNNRVLARFAEELHEAGAAQLEHLCQRAEGNYCSDLGPRMRALADEERARRVFTVALMPLPPVGDTPQAGPRPSSGVSPRRSPIYAAVTSRFGGVL